MKKIIALFGLALYFLFAVFLKHYFDLGQKQTSSAIFHSKNVFHVTKITKATISKMANAVNIEVPESASSTTENCGPTDSKSMYFKDKQ